MNEKQQKINALFRFLPLYQVTSNKNESFFIRLFNIIDKDVISKILFNDFNAIINFIRKKNGETNTIENSNRFLEKIVEKFKSYDNGFIEVIHKTINVVREKEEENTKHSFDFIFDAIFWNFLFDLELININDNIVSENFYKFYNVPGIENSLMKVKNLEPNYTSLREGVSRDYNLTDTKLVKILQYLKPENFIKIQTPIPAFYDTVQQNRQAKEWGNLAINSMTNTATAYEHMATINPNRSEEFQLTSKGLSNLAKTIDIKHRNTFQDINTIVTQNQTEYFDLAESTMKEQKNELIQLREENKQLRNEITEWRLKLNTVVNRKADIKDDQIENLSKQIEAYIKEVDELKQELFRVNEQNKILTSMIEKYSNSTNESKALQYADRLLQVADGVITMKEENAEEKVQMAAALAKKSAEVELLKGRLEIQNKELLEYKQQMNLIENVPNNTTQQLLDLKDKEYQLKTQILNLQKQSEVDQLKIQGLQREGQLNQEHYEDKINMIGQQYQQDTKLAFAMGIMQGKKLPMQSDWNQSRLGTSYQSMNMIESTQSMEMIENGSLQNRPIIEDPDEEMDKIGISTKNIIQSDPSPTNIINEDKINKFRYYFTPGKFIVPNAIFNQIGIDYKINDKNAIETILLELLASYLNFKKEGYVKYINGNLTILYNENDNFIEIPITLYMPIVVYNQYFDDMNDLYIKTFIKNFSQETWMNLQQTVQSNLINNDTIVIEPPRSTEPVLGKSTNFIEMVKKKFNPLEKENTKKSDKFDIDQLRTLCITESMKLKRYHEKLKTIVDDKERFQYENQIKKTENKLRSLSKELKRRQTKQN